MTTTQTATASERITAEVCSWPGISAGYGRRGEFAFKLGHREVGHLHGDHAAHYFFAEQQWTQLKEQGRIEPHPVFPDRRGPAARRIADEADVRDVIELMRLNYTRIVERYGVPADDMGAQANRPEPAQSPGPRAPGGAKK